MSKGPQADRHKPNKCYYKPARNKPRYFSEADAARVFCQAKADTGATEAGFKAKCACWKEPQSECDKLREYVEQILEALAAMILILTLPQTAIVRALALLSRVLPRRWRLIQLLEQSPRISTELSGWVAKGRELLKLPP